MAEPADGAQRERDELTRLATDAMFLAADMLEIAIEAGSRSGDPRLGETIELAQTLMRWGATRTAATAANRSRR